MPALNHFADTAATHHLADIHREMKLALLGDIHPLRGTGPKHQHPDQKFATFDLWDGTLLKQEMLAANYFVGLDIAFQYPLAITGFRRESGDGFILQRLLAQIIGFAESAPRTGAGSRRLAGHS